ncbi:MAG: autotransporter assembly complex family protein [Amphritea sp.]
MFKRWASCFFILLLLASPVSNLMAASSLTVKIDGVSSDQEKNIRGLLRIQQLEGKEIENRSRLRFLHSKADKEIRRALQPFGLYRPDITSLLSEKEQQWTAHYQISPGPVLLIGNLDIQLLGEALQDDKFNQLMTKPSLRSGNPLLHSDYESFKRQFRSLATERGYFQAEFTQHRVEVDLDSYQASITLHFNSGPRFHVGELRITPGPLSSDFIMRYVPFKPGDPINSNALINLQTALIDSDYFQRVEIRPLWDQTEGTEVPILIELEANKRTKYRAGLGYGTDTGARTKLGVTRRWVNNRGHQFKSQLLASEILSSLTAEYSIPGEKPQQDRYAVNLSLSDENSDSIDAFTSSLGVSWQQQRGQWQQILALNYELEEFTFSVDTQNTEFLIPRINFNTVSTNDRLNVRSGYRLSVELLGASDVLLSDADFLQARFNGKVIHSLTPKLRVLGRVETGLTHIDDFNTLPATLRFFAGGDNSVRGYAYQSLGPKDPFGTVIGGPHLLVGSVELDYRIMGNWGIAAFIDSGNAFEGTDINLRTGVGVGLRWFSPIGPVRIDIAAPQDDDESGVRLHFSLGPDL